MTANEFREFALSLPETEEQQHMNHPDFRVAGKIFANAGLSPQNLRHGQALARGPALFLE
jgi:hypothetical protein